MAATPEAAVTAEAGVSPAPASVLPARCLPRVAHFARGPFLDARLVTPSDFKWRNARTYVVENVDGLNYRAVRVTVNRHHYGWWAVELLGTPLPLGDELPEPEPVGVFVELADGRVLQLPAGWREIDPDSGEWLGDNGEVFSS